MAARLESAAVPPVLRLASKAALAAFAVFLFRANGGILTFLFFFVVFWLFYFRPRFKSRALMASAIILFLLPVFLPPASNSIEWSLAAVLGLGYFLLLGVKNLVLLKREGGYETLQTLVVFGVAMLYFLNFLPLLPQIVLFTAFFFLFKEFYFTRAPLYPQRLTLAAAALAFVLTEIAWVLSFLSTSLLAGAAFLALTTHLFHDTLLRHFEGALSRQIVLRNATVFIILSLLLAFLP